MKWIRNHSHVIMSSLQNDICQSKQDNDEVVKLVIFNKKLFEVVSGDLVGRVSHLDDLLKMCSTFSLVLEDHHELLEVLLFFFL